MEPLLVLRSFAKQLLPRLCTQLAQVGVTIRGCEKTLEFFHTGTPASEEDWSTEYLDLVLSIRVVENFEGAIQHIRAYSSGHTEAIVTEDDTRAQEFVRRNPSSAVMVNASTRFNDGGELGLGAEIGISTSKLHAFGPMGLRELTTRKFIVFGSGQIRK